MPRQVPAALFEPAKATDSIIAALKALAAGKASEGQQIAALYWIIEHASGVKNDPFVADNARLTDYRLGRRSVGLQIAALITLSPRPGKS